MKLFKRFQPTKETTMSEVKKLEVQIREAEADSKSAREAAAQAGRDYDNAIAKGDISGADAALTTKAKDERQAQIYADLAVQLETRRRDAESVDNTPAAHAAIDAAEKAADEEREAVGKYEALITEIPATIEALKNAIAGADTAFAHASECIKRAHLREHRGVARDGFRDQGTRFITLAQTAAGLIQAPSSRSIHERKPITEESLEADRKARLQARMEKAKAAEAE